MPAIPPAILKKLYVKGSLRAEGDGFVLSLQNPIAPGVIQGFKGLTLDGKTVPIEQVHIVQPDGQNVPAGTISEQNPVHFPVGATVTLRASGVSLGPGDHQLGIRVVVKDVGPLEIPITDKVE
ncbi:MAG: hypothetical protein RML46_00890 [Anaerolineae bacterium]|nr:hypothetical protein [Anaerolineae bacterium]MDW8067450.1 hypothetical protein [Anaerolineae bacterium]